MRGPGPARASLLGGRYELLTLLATGGMGQVWRARDIVLQRPVAVKVLRSEYTGDTTFLARFRAEAQHTAALTHRNIAALFDYGETPAEDGELLAYLVMELVEGESLAQLLTREGRLTPDRTLDVLGQAAAGLAAAHAAGLVHRDVKPGNVLVGTDGTVKITDFGIAWSAGSAPLTQTGQVVGTAHYLSPEQAAGEKAGPASDVYALGMIGYECLAGRRAFDGDNSVQIALRQLREQPAPLPGELPEPVRTLIDRALLKDPAARFPDGAAFRQAVEDVRAGRSLPPVPRLADTRPFVAAGERPRPLHRRLAAPVVALVAGIGLGVAALQVWADAPSAPVTQAEAESPEPVVLRAEDVVGRPADEVADELTEKGLGIERVAEETSVVAAGDVVSVSPVGTLPLGTVVTLTYAAAPAPPPAPPSPVPAPVPVPTMAVAPVAPAAGGDGQDTGSDGAGGRGNGNGNNDGPPAAGNGNGNAGGNGTGTGNGRGRGRKG